MSLTTQKRNAGLVDQLTPDLQVRNEPNFAWKSVVAQFRAIPALRAMWSFAAVDYIALTQCLDQAGGGYHLTNNNASGFGYQSNTLVPNCSFDGVNQYLSRGDGGAGNWADVTGAEAYVLQWNGLTCGGWYWFDNDAGGNPEACLSKWDNTTNNRSYMIQRANAGGGGLGQFVVSGNGIASIFVSTTAAVPGGEWHFLVGRFVPNTKIDAFWNPNTPTDYQTNNVGIPAAIFDSAAAFAIGARAVPSNYLDGKAGPCSFLAACALSDSFVWQLYEQSRVMYNRLD